MISEFIEGFIPLFSVKVRLLEELTMDTLSTDSLPGIPFGLQLDGVSQSPLVPKLHVYSPPNTELEKKQNKMKNTRIFFMQGLL